MSIDWITVAAQIVNFLVLVWLLKRFLYRPILDGIDAREAEISKRMEEALVAKGQAEETEAEYLEKTRVLHVEQSEMSETIRTAAEAQRDTLLAEAQSALTLQQANWQKHLEAEGRKYTARLQEVGGKALMSITRKALADLADETLEGRIAQHLVGQMADMSDQLKAAAGEAAVAVVTSSEDLPRTVQSDLEAELNAQFPDVVVKFEVNGDQSSGVVLQIGGAQLAWTVASYVEELQGAIAAQLAASSDPQEKPNGQ